MVEVLALRVVREHRQVAARPVIARDARAEGRRHERQGVQRLLALDGSRNERVEQVVDRLTARSRQADVLGNGHDLLARPERLVLRRALRQRDHSRGSRDHDDRERGDPAHTAAGAR